MARESMDHHDEASPHVAQPCASGDTKRCQQMSIELQGALALAEQLACANQHLEIELAQLQDMLQEKENEIKYLQSQLEAAVYEEARMREELHTSKQRSLVEPNGVETRSLSDGTTKLDSIKHRLASIQQKLVLRLESGSLVR